MGLARCRIELANYFAAAFLMPYESFFETAERMRYDIDRTETRNNVLRNDNAFVGVGARTYPTDSRTLSPCQSTPSCPSCSSRWPTSARPAKT